MNADIEIRKREKWVDDVKVIACILVVLGHFFQSISSIGPIIADWMMNKTKWLEFFLYPNQFLNGCKH